MSQTITKTGFEVSLENYRRMIQNYTADGYKAWKHACNVYLDSKDIKAFNGNWKDPTNPISTTLVSVAINIATYYIEVLGGFEIQYTGTNNQTMVITSKGYYHYIGS